MITALMNAAQSNTWPFTVKVPPLMPPPPISPINGSRNDSVNAVTSAVKAMPMTTATARSTMLPRSRKSLKPLIMSVIHHIGDLDRTTADGVSGGGRLTVRVAVVATAASRAAVAGSTASTSRPAAGSTSSARRVVGEDQRTRRDDLRRSTSGRAASTSTRSPARTRPATARSASRTGAATCPPGAARSGPAPPAARR